VHHRTLLPVCGRPHGGLVVGCLLEHDVDGPSLTTVRRVSSRT
jgi:hypothetical protein